MSRVLYPDVDEKHHGIREKGRDGGEDERSFTRYNKLLMVTGGRKDAFEIGTLCSKSLRQ